MTNEQLAQLGSVNREVNALPFHGVPGADEPPDWWTDQPMLGRSWVCRDYVQLKADKLKAMGWDADALTTLLCWTEVLPDTEARGYHAVLAVQPAGEPVAMILDSRFDEIYPMNAPPADYIWERRQIAGSVEYASVA